MINRKILGGIAAVAVLAGMVATTPVQAQKYEFKLTSFVPAKGGFWNNYMGRFIKAVDLLTNGEVKIKGYSVGVLAGPFDGWAAVQKGTADICYCYPGFAVNADPANGIFAGMVGGMPMEEYMHWLIAGDGIDLLTEMRSKTQKLVPIATGFGSTEIFLHSHKKIRTIADLKGMKIRTAAAWADILKRVGASPTVTTFSWNTAPPGPLLHSVHGRNGGTSRLSSQAERLARGGGLRGSNHMDGQQILHRCHLLPGDRPTTGTRGSQPHPKFPIQRASNLPSVDSWPQGFHRK